MMRLWNWIIGLFRKPAPVAEPEEPIISGLLDLVKVDATLVTHLPCPNGRYMSFRAFDAYRAIEGF